MTSSRDEPQLTEAANAALEEYLADIRAEVLWRANDAASQAMVGQPVEITVRDVVAAVEQAAQHGNSAGRWEYRERVLRAYALVSAGLAVVGGLLWVGPELSSVSPQARIGLVSSLVGVFGVIASRAALETLRSRSSRGREGVSRGGSDLDRLTGAFLSQYTDLELAIRDFNARTLGETVAGRSPTLAALNSGVLDHRTSDELRRAVDVRNRLVHGKATSDAEIRAVMVQMQRLRERIEGS